jgi:two-component system, sensor histidine kinase ChiS
MRISAVILIIVFLTSCKDGSQGLSVVSSDLSVSSISDTISSINNGIIPPEIVKAGNPIIVRASQPTISKTNLNVVKLNSKKVKTIIVKDIPEFTPGIDGIKLPVVNEATHNRIVAGSPEVTEVKSAYYKEKNPHSFKFYTRLQGLKHDDISQITQDSYGNLWVGSYFSGATKFDGKYFSYFSEEQGLAKNRVTSILEDNKGNIWFGTVGGGVSKYDGKYFINYTVNEGLSNNNVEYIFQDSKNNIWLGTYGGGVSVFDGVNFTNYSVEQGLSDSIVYNILEDKNNNIWIGTIDGGICKFDGEKFYHYTTKQGLSDNFVLSAIEDSNGDIWVGTNRGGVSKIHLEEETNISKISYYNVGNGLKTNSILSLLEDDDGSIWIGTRGGGVTSFDGEFFHHYGLNEGLISESINAIFEDRDGNLWFGTMGAGLSRFQGKVFSHYTNTEGLINSTIRSILQDKSGNLWFGSNGDGVFIYDGTTFYNISENEGLTSNYIRDIIKDSTGNLWIGTSGGGISMFDGTYFFHYNENQGICNDFIFSMLEDKKGNLWLGTSGGGACKITFNKSNKPDSIVHYRKENGLPGNDIVDIIQDKDGNIWLATNYDGISKFDGESFFNYDVTDGLPSNEITTIREDSRGNIWIGHYGAGITYFNGKTFVNLTQKDGLVNDYVFSILEDELGNMWFGTRYGLSLLNLENVNKLSRNYKNEGNDILIVFKNYTHEEGFLGIGCNPRAIFKDNENKIWIGANDHLTIYKPKKQEHQTSPPSMMISGLELFNEYIDWTVFHKNKDTVLLLDNGIKLSNLKFDDFDKWSKMPINLSLSYENNYLTFKFIGITTSFSDKIKYQYKLDGLDNNWSLLVSRTEAHYANLPPGSYTFRVKALNSEGAWSNEDSFSFRIRPPWWDNWIAYLVYSIMFLIIAGIFYKSRRKFLYEKHVERQKAILLEQEVEIARKAVEFKQNFLANMSHEIRTPLTGILGMADIIAKTNLDDNQKEYLTTLIQSGENLREIIDLILDYSKIEAGKVKLKNIEFSLSTLLSNLEKLYKPICLKKGVDFKLILSSQIPEIIYSDMQKIGQILNNLLSNAVKFTDKGAITLKASLDNKSNNHGILKDKKTIGIRIEVHDTGKGVDFDEQGKIFLPFTRIEQDQVKRIEGTGLGLSISKELTDILGGKIGVKSQVGNGSIFWFTFKAAIIETQHKNTKMDKQENVKPHKSINILLVEDKPITQKVVKIMLNSLGHNVDFADNGEEALSVFNLQKHKLVLMDIQMPVMDGVTATRRLRENYRDLPPIVGLSANAFEGDREKYLALGLDEYLTKPVKEDDFIALINKLNL